MVLRAWRQPHSAPVQAKFLDSGTSRWKGGQVSCVGVRKSPPRWTDKSWQSCWPSQEPGVALFAVLLPELWKPKGQVVSALCPGEMGRLPSGPSRDFWNPKGAGDSCSQGWRVSWGSEWVERGYSPALRWAGVSSLPSTNLCPSRCSWQAGGCGPGQPSPSGCCFCNLEQEESRVRAPQRRASLIPGLGATVLPLRSPHLVECPHSCKEPGPRRPQQTLPCSCLSWRQEGGGRSEGG